jgi:hypothetical protein
MELGSLKTWYEKLPPRTRHLLTELQFNPNHRHDEAHEKATDAKRKKIAESHRYRSFAPGRDGNNIKWYVDGRDYFWVGHWYTVIQQV